MLGCDGGKVQRPFAIDAAQVVVRNLIGTEVLAVGETQQPLIAAAALLIDRKFDHIGVAVKQCPQQLPTFKRRGDIARTSRRLLARLEILLHPCQVVTGCRQQRRRNARRRLQEQAKGERRL